MKVNRIILILLCLCLLAACGKTNPPSENVSSMWDLGKRYDSNYSKIGHTYRYVKGETEFYLSVTHSKANLDSLKNVTETKTIGNDTFALCEPVSLENPQDAQQCRYYVCLDGSYRYTLGNTETPIDMSQVLSFEEAASMLKDAHALPDGVVFLYEEWTGYYRLASCNIEIYVYPSDNGSHTNLAAEGYEQREENGTSYFYSDKDCAILYTDGVNTVWIRQTNRSGSEHTSYSTLAECRAILALLAA